MHIVTLRPYVRHAGLQNARFGKSGSLRRQSAVYDPLAAGRPQLIAICEPGPARVQAAGVGAAPEVRIRALDRIIFPAAYRAYSMTAFFGQVSEAAAGTGEHVVIRHGGLALLRAAMTSRRGHWPSVWSRR